MITQKHKTTMKWSNRIEDIFAKKKFQSQKNK